MKAVICVGISGSGKTTWANEEVDGIVINRDDTRWEVSGKRGWNGSNAYKFDKFWEDMVTIKNYQALKECAENSTDVIISDTNLNTKFRNKLIEQCAKLGYEVEIKEFPISFQEACKRDKERGIYAVGEAVLMKQWESWIKYHEEEQQGAW